MDELEHRRQAREDVVSTSAPMHPSVSFQRMTPWILALIPLFGVMLVGLPLYAQATDSYDFEIPSQPLDQALKAFSATTDLLLSYEAGMTAGRTSSAISGRYTSEEALRRLLADTGLEYRFANDRTVTLRPATNPVASPPPPQSQSLPADPDTISGGRDDQKPVKVPEVLIKEVHYRDDEKSYVAEEASTATRTDTPIRDVPQSIQVITRKVIDEQRVFRLSEALQNIAGINTTLSTQTMFDDFIIRGFPARANNYFRNGLFDATQNAIATDTSNIQRIEVLKGPASVLYGQGDPGGIINIVTEKPLSDAAYMGNVTLGSYNFYRSEIDAAGPLNASKTFLYRLNVAGQKAKSFIDIVNRDMVFVAPAVTWLAGPRTSFTVEGDYLNRMYNNIFGLPAQGTILPNVNGEIPRNRYTGLGEFDRNNRRSYRVGYDLSHHFNDHWSIRNAYRYSILEIDTLSAQNGSLAANQRTLSRVGVLTDAVGREHHHTMLTNLIGRFRLLNMDHTFLTGVELRQDKFNPRNVMIAAAPPIDLFTPDYSPGLGSTTSAFLTKQDSKLAGAYVQDQIALLPNVKFMGSLRFDYLHQSINPTSARTDTSDDTAVSPRLGLVYQPIDPVSLYASWSRGFLPNSASSFNPDGRLFEPERATQYEIGMKTFLFDNRIAATLAWFHLTRENIITNDPVLTGFSVQTGEQRSQGVELDVTATLASGWNLIASYAYTDAEVTRDNNVAILNKRLANVPYNKATLWSTFHFQEGLLQGFGIGGGVYGYTSRNASIFGPQREMPGYVRLDAALYYDRPFTARNWLGAKALHAQINVRNLLDHRYIELARNSTTQFHYAEALSVLATVGLEF
jgi:iron complex outermembrane recepter protein